MTNAPITNTETNPALFDPGALNNYGNGDKILRMQQLIAADDNGSFLLIEKYDTALAAKLKKDFADADLKIIGTRKALRDQRDRLMDYESQVAEQAAYDSQVAELEAELAGAQEQLKTPETLEPELFVKLEHAALRNLPFKIKEAKALATASKSAVTAKADALKIKKT